MHGLDGPDVPKLAWKDELRLFLEVIRAAQPPAVDDRRRHADLLEATLTAEIYPAFEDFLGEMTRHGVGGQIYGRDSGYAITLRLDDGFELAVERDRYREQAQLLPRLIAVVYRDEGGRRYFTGDGVAWDRIKRAEAVCRVLEEYTRWHLSRAFTG